MTNEERRIKDILIGRFGLSCWGCDVDIGDEKMLILDHIIPKNDGGADTIENRALLCNHCNSQKGDRCTISNLRQINKVREHSVGLKAAMEFIREKRKGEILAEYHQLPLTMPATVKYEQQAVATETLTPGFDDFVLGMRQTRQLLWIRGHKEMAEALGGVVLIRGYCFGGPVEFHIHVNRDAAEQFNFIVGANQESCGALLQALCQSYTARPTRSSYYVFLDARPLEIASSVTPFSPMMEGEYHVWQYPSDD